ncbi:Guanylate kinase, partial [Globisporangium splendens]
MADGGKKALEALSFEELSLLNERKEALKKDHETYVDAHPEIKTLLSAFMSALLIEKPADVLAFAKTHFATYKPQSAELTPLVIAGPSGVGKGTLINKLLQQYPHLFGFSVSHTTRGPREGEVDGVAYHFKPKEQVQEEIDAGLFLEHAQVHGNIYGTSKRAVESVQEQNKICILDIDIQGVQQVKQSGIMAKYLFISPPSMVELEKRLRGRATETEDKIQLRVKNAAGELEFSKQPGMFDENLVNENVDESFAKLLQILQKWYPKVNFS